MSRENKPLDNLSLTGYRVVSILKMLQDAPHSEQEINEKFQNDPIVSRSISRDSIWLYINTLKSLGCQISRPSRRNDFKYILKKHPFNLKLTEQEIKALAVVKNYISELSDWEVSCDFDNFVATMIKFLGEENKKMVLEYFKNSSREIDYALKTDLITELKFYCEKKDYISLIYSSPSNKSKEVLLLSEYLKYENGALYLWGYNLDIEEYQYLRVDRIESVRVLNTPDVIVEKNVSKAIIKLYGLQSISYHPEETERIIDKQNDGLVIEILVKNRFKLVQKILSFGKECEVIEPDDLKEEILNKLKVMSSLYDDE